MKHASKGVHSSSTATQPQQPQFEPQWVTTTVDANRKAIHSAMVAASRVPSVMSRCSSQENWTMEPGDDVGLISDDALTMSPEANAIRHKLETGSTCDP